MLIDTKTVTSSPAQIVAGEPNRRWLVLQNTGDANAFILIAESNATEVTVSNGLRLIPGAIMFLNASEKSNPANQPIRAVSSGSTTIRIQGGNNA